MGKDMVSLTIEGEVRQYPAEPVSLQFRRNTRKNIRMTSCLWCIITGCGN